MSIVATRVPPKRLPPGTEIEVTVGALKLRATVVEDLGPIAPDDKHLVRVRAPMDSGAEEAIFDISVDVESLPIRER